MLTYCSDPETGIERHVKELSTEIILFNGPMRQPVKQQASIGMHGSPSVDSCCLLLDYQVLNGEPDDHPNTHQAVPFFYGTYRFSAVYVLS